MTDKLELRALEKEDLDFIHRLNNNPDIMSFWFEEPYQTKAELEENYMKNKDNKHVRLFILEKSNEQLGLVALFSIDYIHRKAEFAIMIDRSEEHTSELQSRGHLVCRLLLEKKNY